MRLIAFIFYAVRLLFSDLINFIPSKFCIFLLKIKFYTFSAFSVYFMFLSLVFCKFLVQNGHFALKMYSKVSGRSAAGNHEHPMCIP